MYTLNIKIESKKIYRSCSSDLMNEFIWSFNDMEQNEYACYYCDHSVQGLKRLLRIYPTLYTHTYWVKAKDGLMNALQIII